jgi:phosphoribosylanthranilate isomerase
MSTQVKICGISTPAALDAAITGRADYCGLVFFAPSPRNVTPAIASALAARSAGAIRRVGLFVDADDALLAEGVAAGRLDAVQLHGSETPARAAAIRARFGLPVWKALAVAKASDITAAEQWRGVADLVLYDAKTPRGAALPGGMGLRFDWGLLAHRPRGIAWGLAGGLSPANVAEAIRQTGAALVDTSSGVERAPGDKDPELIRQFCEAARAA